MGALCERQALAEVVARERQGRGAGQRQRIVRGGRERRVVGAVGALVEAGLAGLARP